VNRNRAYAKDLRPGMWAVVPKPGIDHVPMRVMRAEFGNADNVILTLDGARNLVYLDETELVLVVPPRPKTVITWDADAGRWDVAVTGGNPMVTVVEEQ
jgi:hypothetical protein